MFLVVVVFLTFGCKQPLVLVIFIKEFPTCFIVERCVKDAASSNCLRKVLYNGLHFTIRDDIATLTTASLLDKAKNYIFFIASLIAS